MNLSGQEKRKLREALMSAYPEFFDVQELVDTYFNTPLNHITKEKTNHREVVFDLVTWAKSKGKLEKLIVVAYEDNSDNPELKKFYLTVFQNFKQKAILDNTVTQPQDFGPNIDWRGKTDKLELERFLKKQPDWYDVGFLQRILEQSQSVCRINLPSFNISATGVLVTPRLVLTNYHVLKVNDSDDIETYTKNVELSFGCFSLDGGKEVIPQSFRLDADKPILASSPIEKLDYVLLQVESKFANTLDLDDTQIKPTQWNSDINLTEAEGINILQHPNGESMKLSITCDGITGIYPNSGLVQYINKTAGGSSGSPCFNEEGKLVALHHAQRSKSFGTIREGILFSSIYEDLKDKSISLN